MKGILLIVLAVLCFTASAQEFEKRFYDADDKLTDEANSVYYSLRKVTHNAGDTARSYYTKTGSIHSMSIVQANGIRNGLAMEYYENGTVKVKGHYEKGTVSGEARSWYADGSPQSIEIFLPAKENEMGNFTLSDYWDPKRNHIVINGNGYCECFLNVFVDDPFSEAKFLAKGKIIDGVRDSVWVGYRNDGTKYYEEIYEHGTLRNGFSLDTVGVRYTYTTRYAMPIAKGEWEGLKGHLKRTLIYPKSARKNRIAGTVYVEFIIAEDGEVTDVKVLKGIGGECDDEAVRVVKLCPPWTPGKMRGQPVKTRFVLPIVFKL